MTTPVSLIATPVIALAQPLLHRLAAVGVLLAPVLHQQLDSFWQLSAAPFASTISLSSVGFDELPVSFDTPAGLPEQHSSHSLSLENLSSVAGQAPPVLMAQFSTGLCNHWLAYALGAGSFSTETATPFEHFLLDRCAKAVLKTVLQTVFEPQPSAVPLAHVLPQLQGQWLNWIWTVSLQSKNEPNQTPITGSVVITLPAWVLSCLPLRALSSSETALDVGWQEEHFSVIAPVGVGSTRVPFESIGQLAVGDLLLLENSHCRRISLALPALEHAVILHGQHQFSARLVPPVQSVPLSVFQAEEVL